jgi:hypothetical protein
MQFHFDTCLSRQSILVKSFPSNFRMEEKKRKKKLEDSKCKKPRSTEEVFPLSLEEFESRIPIWGKQIFLFEHNFFFD